MLYEVITYLALAGLVVLAIFFSQRLEIQHRLESNRQDSVITSYSIHYTKLYERASKHLFPRLLRNELGKLASPVEVFVTHLKPGQAAAIIAEIESGPGPHPAT